MAMNWSHRQRSGRASQLTLVSLLALAAAAFLTPSGTLALGSSGMTTGSYTNGHACLGALWGLVVLGAHWLPMSGLSCSSPWTPPRIPMYRDPQALSATFGSAQAWALLAFSAAVTPAHAAPHPLQPQASAPPHASAPAQASAPQQGQGAMKQPPSTGQVDPPRLEGALGGGSPGAGDAAPGQVSRSADAASPSLLRSSAVDSGRMLAVGHLTAGRSISASPAQERDPVAPSGKDAPPPIGAISPRPEMQREPMPTYVTQHPPAISRGTSEGLTADAASLQSAESEELRVKKGAFPIGKGGKPPVVSDKGIPSPISDPTSPLLETDGSRAIPPNVKSVAPMPDSPAPREEHGPSSSDEHRHSLSHEGAGHAIPPQPGLSTVSSPAQASGQSSSDLGPLRGSPYECDPDGGGGLKVFVYDLHQKFNWALFDKNITSKDLDALPHKPSGPVHQGFTRRPNGTLPRFFEHSAESFIISDLLYPPKANSSTTLGNEVVKVEDPAEADVFLVPFLASLSFNVFSRLGMHSESAEVDKRLQEELMDRSGGHDHILPMVHPNALRFVRDENPSPMFLVADFGRAPQATSRLSKDIVVPYNHMLPTFQETSQDGERTWAHRTTLLYFQGTVKRRNEGYIRKLLYDMLKDTPDVHFVNSKGDAEGMRTAYQGMRKSKFCLHAAGDTPSSCRLFDAIVNHCVPVILSNKLELPFESQIDYSEFAIFISDDDSLREGYLLSLLRNMPKEEWLRRWRLLLDVASVFNFQTPSLRGDAVSMVWREVKLKLPLIHQSVNKYRRRALAQLETSP